jgi:hypothetical protein
MASSYTKWAELVPQSEYSSYNPFKFFENDSTLNPSKEQLINQFHKKRFQTFELYASTPLIDNGQSFNTYYFDDSGEIKHIVTNTFVHSTLWTSYSNHMTKYSSPTNC